MDQKAHTNILLHLMSVCKLCICCEPWLQHCSLTSCRHYEQSTKRNNCACLNKLLQRIKVMTRLYKTLIAKPDKQKQSWIKIQLQVLGLNGNTMLDETMHMVDLWWETHYVQVGTETIRIMFIYKEAYMVVMQWFVYQ